MHGVFASYDTHMTTEYFFLLCFVAREVTFLNVGDARLWWKKTIVGMSRACSLIECNSLNDIRKRVKVGGCAIATSWLLLYRCYRCMVYYYRSNDSYNALLC